MRAHIANGGARRRARTLSLALTLALLIPASAASAHHRDDHGNNPTPSPAPSTATTLVLYDTAGTWGWMGEKYAIASANLASHFGSWTAKPVAEYTAGEMASYTRRDLHRVDVRRADPELVPGRHPRRARQGRVARLEHLAALEPRRSRPFKTKYGWKDGYFNNDDIPTVTYKGSSFTRNVEQPFGDGLHLPGPEQGERAGYRRARPPATRSRGRSRSGNLTYVGEVPFSYMTETDRYLIFSDLLFDVLAPGTPERHRALVRLEDVGCDADPEELVDDRDYLDGKGIPFSFGVYPVYKNPLGRRQRRRSADASSSADRECRTCVDAIEYMIDSGGTMLMHGYTHQCRRLAANPYNGKSGDDFEFFTAHVDAEDYVRYDGPVPGDSYDWALGRLTLRPRSSSEQA